MPPRGGRGGGGGPRGGGMGGGPRGGMGGGPRMNMGGGRPRGNMGGMGMGMGRPPRRGGSFFDGIIGFVVVLGILLFTFLDSLSPVVWVALAVVAIVGIYLSYKYKSDRAKAEETQRILDTDLGNADDSSGLGDLEDKYK